jgi:hypothetical protein
MREYRVRILALTTVLMSLGSVGCLAQTSVAPDAKHLDTKMVGSAYSSNAEKQPALQLVLPFALSRGLLTAERSLISSPGKESFGGDRFIRRHPSYR